MQVIILRILDELRGSWRFRWPALLAAWVVCVAGWVFVFAMPNVYEASARVYVDSQTALGPLLRGLALDPNVESEVSIVRQALLSRPQLEAVSRKTDLHLRAKTPEEMETLLDSLQKHIQVVNAVRAGRSDTDGLYRISFQDNNRQISLAVVETLLTNFVEQTLGSKRTGQESAQRFLEDEIRELERRLTESETRLADFKKKNVGSMPGEGGDYFARLQTEIAGEKATRDALSLADTRRNELQRQLSGEDPFLFGLDSGAPGAGNDSEAGGDITYRIQELESRLEEMLLKYTEKHPEVLAVRSTIDELKKRQQEEIERVGSGKRATGSMANSLKANPIYQGIQAETNRTDVQIAELRQDLAQRSARVADLKRLVDSVPEVEAELVRLNRDYDITRTRYLELVERRETAKLSESADKQGNVKFQILDPPVVGFEPVAPKRIPMLLAVLVVGLGAGGALAWLLNQLRPVYQNVRVLAENTGLPVLGFVSRTLLDPQKNAALRARLAFGTFVGALVLVCGAAVVFSDSVVGLTQRLLGQA
jgi:polysaccharide chain length determinant protein (PEP-CTERM system associated)